MKICGKCKVLLTDECFRKRSGNRKHQLQSYCIECQKYLRKFVYIKPTSEKYMEVYYKRREKICQQRRDRYKKNKKKYKEQNRLWRAKESAKQYKRISSKERYNNNVNERLGITLRSRIRKTLKSVNLKKLNKLNELLGCTVNFFKSYIEKLFKTEMTWKKYGKWHIDHIRPCASYDLTLLDNQLLCFNYKNLQPLWANENLSKGCKYEN
jgi:hypothetical protein